MESLYKLQNNKKVIIEKAQINFKKAPKDRITKVYVETRLESLEALWKEFSSTHNNIIQIATDAQQRSDSYFVDDVYDTTEELYIFHKTHLREVLGKYGNCISEQKVKTNDHTISNSVKLPKISIPKFSGNYEEWTTFKDLFTSLIHNNECLEDVQKMYYLKGLLSGEADQLVRHIAVTSDNYKECWSMLHNRYNNKRFLSNCLLKRLLSQGIIIERSSSIKGLLDTTMECLSGLKNLGIDVSTWDIIIIYIISSKLDPESRKQWETKISSKDELPVLSEFREFLEARFRALEFLDTSSNKPKPNFSFIKKPFVHHVVSADNNTEVTIICPFCEENHKISNCKKFANESYESRQSFAQTRRLCYNCLNSNHSIKFCRQSSSCRMCKRRHHSLLHPKSVSNPSGSNESSEAEAEVKSTVSKVQVLLSECEPSTSNIVSHFSKGSIPKQVLLATALVEAQTRSGSTQLLRVLLDQGSQASFIAESAVQLLGLKKIPVKSVISGIGGEKSAFASKFKVTVTIHSRFDPNFSVQVHAFVLRNVTSFLPSEKLEKFNWPELTKLTLADPEFHTPSKIDIILLGAEVYGQVLRDGIIQGPPNLPVAQNTVLGWIISGQISSNQDSIHCHHVIHSSTNQADDNALLQQFWEIESIIPAQKILSEEEQRCEEIFAQTTYRDEDGRYVVDLPFRDQYSRCQYGSSRDLDIEGFHLLENKFKRNPGSKSRYSEEFQELTPEPTEWETYRESFVETNKFSILRWVNTRANNFLVELHGFYDASIAAYAAVVYVRIIDAPEKIHVSLITAQTKVVPVKQQSFPRLELMGAVLLSELISEVAKVMKISSPQIHAWTDSSIVLAWLSKHPSHWTTFVGNRTSTILSHFDNSHWAHVQSTHNPADLASRGLTPQELASNSLWSRGPPWLHNETIEYTRPKSISTNTEQRSIKVHVITEPRPEDPVWTKYSSLQRLIRVIAYCRRVLSWKKQSQSEGRYEKCLTAEELQKATKTCIRHVQKQEFEEDMSDIRKTGSVKSRSKLRSLCPFIDDDGILRVNGRLQNANLDETIKHPIILPSDSHFTRLIIDDAHKTTLHGGPTLMLSHLRTKYWILAAKTKVKAHVRKCVKCRRYSVSTQTPFMGQLPSSRVTPARPFLHSGVDFAGPISIRTSKGRGHNSYKGYICVFVCMVTKAIHLEVISDLTSQGFIAGFKRFVARRGFVSDIWSDNGTNFVGASKELQHLVAAEKSSVAEEIREWLGNNSTTWHFIPPHSPNFGGLWEAGVKSTKFHLRRVIGNSTLTYEEMSTLLSQIEACLNSRPLSMLPDTSSDPIPLTPGHFLIGEPLIAVPERNYEASNVSNLRRWQVTQHMLQDFWRRWSAEYLVHLLQRYKWTTHIRELNIGDVVVVKEDNLPPARWLLGRVIEKHPGMDRVTRVVTLKCNGSLIKRPISKLFVLPVTT